MGQALRYNGKVCHKHPELKGERIASSNWCVGCRLEADRKRRKNPARMVRNRDYLRRLRQDPVYAARMREADRQRDKTPERRAQERARRKLPQFKAKRQARYASDPAFALLAKARTRIIAALKGTEKSARTLDLLGVQCIEHYKSYLEKQFEPGMTWENYGQGWHVDHRIPLSLLDLSKPEDQRFGFHYQNTRPMWAEKNRSRGNRIIFEDLI